MRTNRMKKYGFIAAAVILAFIACSCSKSSGPVVAEGSAPDFSLNDLSGKNLRLSDLKGSVVMIEFWATWCPPCRDSVPELNNLYQKYKDRGFVLLGLSVDTGRDAQSTVNSFVKEFNITYPVLIDKSDVKALYGVYSVPTTYLIDRNGNVVNSHIGFAPGSGELLAQEIEKIL